MCSVFLSHKKFLIFSSVKFYMTHLASSNLIESGWTKEGGFYINTCSYL